jgi:hypothetical protein
LVQTASTLGAIVASSSSFLVGDFQYSILIILLLSLAAVAVAAAKSLAATGVDTVVLSGAVGGPSNAVGCLTVKGTSVFAVDAKVEVEVEVKVEVEVAVVVAASVTASVFGVGRCDEDKEDNEGAMTAGPCDTCSSTGWMRFLPSLRSDCTCIVSTAEALGTPAELVELVAEVAALDSELLLLPVVTLLTPAVVPTVVVATPLLWLAAAISVDLSGEQPLSRALFCSADMYLRAMGLLISGTVVCCCCCCSSV